MGRGNAKFAVPGRVVALLRNPMATIQQLQGCWQTQVRRRGVCIGVG